jgi:transposase-like protein
MPRARPTGPNMATDRKLGSGELAPMGGLGGIVEIDETFIGNDRSIKPHGEKRGRGYAHKFKVLALVDRAAGTARTMVVDDLKAATLTPILTDNIAREARVMTDKAGYYSRLGESFAEHEFVRHGAEEWARGEVHTNTLEGFFSIFKRGMAGVYQHCAKKHLHRYAAEFEFRYNHRAGNGCDDAGRTARALAGVKGKRLTYQTTD